MHLFLIAWHLQRFAKLARLLLVKISAGKGSADKVEYLLSWAEARNRPLRLRTNTQRDGAEKFYSALGLSLLKTQSVFQSRQE